MLIFQDELAKKKKSKIPFSFMVWHANLQKNVQNNLVTVFNGNNTAYSHTTKKMKFSIKDSFVNVTTSGVSWGFGHIELKIS